MVPFLFIALFAAAPPFEESFRAGLMALQANDLKAAEVNLEAAASAKPENGRVWIALAQTLRKLHLDAKAEEAANRAARFGASDAPVMQSLAIYYAESGASLKSADALAKYAALNPKDSAARDRAEALYFEAAQALLRQEKFADAIGVLEPGAANLPGSAQLRLALGVAYYGLRRFDDAARAFLATIAISPETEQPYLFLGRFLDQIPDRLPVVTKEFVAYEAAHPSSYAGYFLHARALDAQAQDPDGAAKLLDRAIALNDRDAAVHFEFGTVLDRLQRYAEAAREFGKAASLDPNDPAAHYRLARDYDRLGKHEEAEEERRLHAGLTQKQDAVR